MAEARHGVASVGPAWRRLGLALGAFALIAGALFGLATLADREATLQDGRTSAENTAELLAEQADRALRIAQLTAARVAELAERQGVAAIAGDRWAELARLDRATPEVSALRVVDAEGRLVAWTISREAEQRDLSGEAAFRSLAGGAPGVLVPLTRGHRGTWIFGWAEPIRQGERFLGMVMASLHVEAFRRLAGELDLGPGAELMLLRTDGAVLLRSPMPPGPSPAVPARPGDAGFAEEAGPDGAVRLVAWQAMSAMPAMAVVAISRDHVLAPFHRRLLRNGVLFGLAVALAGGLGAAAIRAGRRETAAIREAEERSAELAYALSDRLNLVASVQVGEARLRAAQQSGGIGLWDLDLGTARIALAGEVFADWGLPGPGSAGFRSVPVRAALRGIHPDDRGALVAAVTRALRKGTRLEVEFRLAGPGPERWIGVRAEARTTGAAQPERRRARRLLGIARDVTGEHQAQQALEEARAGLARRVAERTGELAEANARLREGEARFRGLFNATFQFIGLLSPDGTVLEANAAMLRLGGVAIGDVVGEPYWRAPWWPQEAATQALLRASIAEAADGRFVRRETQMRDAEGRSLAVDFSVTPVRDEDGIVSLLVAEARDVSALKAAQALLHEAQKMDTLGQLTGGVAHDFNNLLMAVLGNLAIVRRRAEKAAPELLRQLDNATQAAERGAALTQRLLAFARRQDLKPVAVDLRGLLLGLEALLRRSAGPLVTLELEAPEDLPPALVDPHALELALVNLAVNARDAMPEGGSLRVRLALEEGALAGRLAAGRWLTVAVADQGAGMDEATLARAVEPFFTTKGPGQGTGLGLSMVHGLAAQSGGALVLESAPGEGTAATLWLPVSAQPKPAEPAAPDAREPEPEPGRGTVLVVDDEVLVLESTAAMLEELGYDPVCASSAAAALEVLHARRDVALVLTDHAMPGMTGAALAVQLMRERPGLPVILATGYAGACGGGEAAPPVLSKPYSLAQLSTALHRAMQETKVG
ncbi:MAG TPA: ATP-binding protein [Falsiroseomonas sp.]|jgi:PAS domain S-box-containing protein|nr:ATP-binding protein [Falsiroseomonas sp.]